MAEIAVAVIVSAIVSAASAGLQYALTPKPKPIERGRLQGDLQLQDSNYGIPVPEVYGGMVGASLAENGVKYAGNIIWASAIRKTETRQKSGGKGGPKQPDVIEINYDLDLAIMFGRGRLKLLKLWAGPDLIYDGTSAVTGAYESVGSDLTYDPLYLPVEVGPLDLSVPDPRYRDQLTTDADGYGSVALAKGAILRFYEGTRTQPRDPVIQADMDARLGANSTPAYRGRSYATLEKFSLSQYGYVPNFRALLQSAEHQTVQATVQGFAARAGLVDSDLQLSPAAGVNMRGYLRPARQAARADLEQLSRAYNVEYADVAGRLTAFVRGRQAYPLVIDSKYLGCVEGEREGNEPPDLIEQKITSEIELPRSLDVKHYDPAREADVGTQHATRQGVNVRRAETLELYCTLTADEAKRIAERELYLAWVESKPASFTLPYTFCYLHAGKLIQTTVAGRTYVLRIVEITGAVPGVLKVAAVPERSYVFDQSATSTSGGNFQTSSPLLPASSACTFIDLALLRDEHDRSGFYVAVGPAISGGNWGGAKLYRDRGAGYSELATVTTGAVMGRAITALGNTNDPTVFDYTNTVTIDLYTGALESATERQALDSANAGVLGSEVIQWQTATPVSGYPRRYVLSGLLRGRQGTEWAAASHAASDRFVLLDSAVEFVAVDPAERSVARSFKAVTSGQNIDDAATLSWAYQAGALTPISVMDIQGVRDGSGNLTLTWKRRTRVGGQWADLVDVPLGETTEKYEIEIMSGATVKRTITSTAQTASYSAADQTTDFGSQQASVTVRVYQISESVGRGRVRAATV